MFGKKEGIRDVAKDEKRNLKRSERDLSKDIQQIDRDMAKLTADIKSSMRRGDESSARILAKQLVRMKEQKSKMGLMQAQLKSTSYSSLSAQATTQNAMMSSTRAMGIMNKQTNVDQMQKLNRAYTMESEKMNMSQAIMDETLDAVFSGDEEVEAEIMSQIYDEIGLECSENMPSAPKSMASEQLTDKDIYDIASGKKTFKETTS